jgi:LPXTG-motif cell wall-anchored protein
MDYSVSPWANEPWAYLNLFVTGSVDVTKVRFTGAGFEYDNLTISTQESGPRGDMVLISNVLNTPPAAQVISWDPTNTSDSGTNASHTPSQAATKTTPNTGGGAISYSVVNAGNSGCTVNSSTGVITRTAIGDCRVRATAAAVPGTYYSAFKEVTFTFSAAPTPTPTPTTAPTPTPTTAPASTAPAKALATTGANLEWLFVAGLLAVIAGSGFLAFSRRKRIW